MMGWMAPLRHQVRSIATLFIACDTIMIRIVRSSHR